jgi:hypothetical protein
MSLDAEQLYELLPAVFRVRDASNGEPLKALMQVIAGQSAIVEDNIRQLYDDEFIETCASWVIPYIGDLVGATPVYEIGAAVRGRRAEVANTIGYRRRKGTVLALEQVAMDVSGMPAVAVEFFKRVITTESMRHVRPKHAGTANLRNGLQLEKFDSAFDMLNRTVDVRRIAPRVRTVSSPDTAPLEIALHGPGKYNVPDVGVYLWRWKSYAVTDQPAFAVDARRYMFSPLGQNIPLFNRPPARDSFAGLTGRLDVPQPIRRREFFVQPANFYGADLHLTVNGLEVDVSRICCRNLSDLSGSAWPCVPTGSIAIDPELGRIAFSAMDPAPASVRVSYCYGFPADFAGGPYDRAASLPAFTSAAFPFLSTVGSPATPTIASAIAAWSTQTAGASGVIVLPDFESWDVNATINVPDGSSLWIVAAQPGTTPVVSESRALLRGDLEVRGTGRLLLNGIWIAGQVRVRDAATVQISDCTLVPGISLTRDGRPVQPGEPSIIASTPGASISLVRSISGPIGVAEGATTRICSSVVDAGSPCSVAYGAADLTSEGADLHVEGSTIVGKIHVRTMELASNSIFIARRPSHDPWPAAIWCGRKQAGCMRFCFVPVDSITPRRYRCLPGDPSQEAALRPQFVTMHYGDPSYLLLSGAVPMAVWTGADNGSQMGVYHFAEETEAVRNVQLRVPEFLPFNLEAGIFLEPSTTVGVPPVPSGYGYGRRLDPCGDPADDELLNVGVGAHLI